MICKVCGKRFMVGNNPITGLPNGLGLQFEETGDKVFNVCSTCVCYRKKKMLECAEKFKRGELK